MFEKSCHVVVLKFHFCLNYREISRKMSAKACVVLGLLALATLVSLWLRVACSPFWERSRWFQCKQALWRTLTSMCVPCDLSLQILAHKLLRSESSIVSSVNYLVIV